MADDLREVKNAITSNLMRQNQDSNKEQDARSIFHFFDLPLKTVEDIEGAVEQLLRIPDNFERSIMYTYMYVLYEFRQIRIEYCNVTYDF